MSCPSHVLARLLALAGHIALRQVVHLDASVLGEMKRRERVKEDEKGEKKNKDRSSSSGRRSETVDATPRVKVTWLFSFTKCSLYQLLMSLKR